MATPTIHSTTAPAAGLSSTSDAGTAVGDLVVVFTWERAGAGPPTHTLQSGFTEIISHSHDDGSTDGRLSVAYQVATGSGANAYQAYTSSVGTETWTGLLVVNAGTYGQSIRAASVTATGTGAPNPPNCTGLSADIEYLVCAISAWHLTASQTLTPTHATYTLQTHVAGAATGDVALATLGVSGVTAVDPGAYADNQTPNGTCSVTLAIPEAIATVANMGGEMLDAAGSGTALAPIINGTMPAGQLIVVASRYEGAATTVTISDTGGNSWTQAAAISNGSVEQLHVHYAVTAAEIGPNTITQTLSVAKVNRSCLVTHYVNTATTSPVDNFDTELDVGATNPATGSITPAADGSLIYGTACNATGTTYAPSGSFVERLQPGTIIDSQCQDFTQTTAASVASTWTAGADDHLSILVVFKPAGSNAFTLAIGAGSYAITGTAASLKSGRLIAAGSGSYTISGTAIGTIHGYKLAAGSGSYTITGTAASLLSGRKLVAGSGSYALTGTAVGLLSGRLISAEPGAYVLSGTDATLTHGVSGAFTLAVDSGSYVVTGSTVGLFAGRLLAAEAGAYALTGSDVTLTYTPVSSGTNPWQYTRKRRR